MCVYDFKINIKIPYKFCDFRPAFGEIFCEDLQNYDFWGTIDLDIVLGKISHFIDDDILCRYDKILARDHFCIYRNSSEVNSRYKCQQKRGNNIYKAVFSDEKIYAFGEMGPWGVYQIWKYNGWNMYLAPICADIAVRYNHFNINGEPKIHKQIFEYTQSGDLVRYGLKNNEIVKTEFMYMHLQKRSMKKQVDLESTYYIVPNAFVNKTNKKELKEEILHYNSWDIFARDYLRIIQRGKNKCMKLVKQYGNYLRTFY